MKRFKTFFFHKRADRHPASLLDAVIDPKAIAKALHVEQLAGDDALHNRPASNAKEPGPSEQTIQRHHQSLLRTLDAQCAARLKASEQQLWKLRGRFDSNRLEAVPMQAEQDHERLQANLHDPLVQARRTERRADRELRAFKHRHRLERDAHQPEGLLLHYAALVFMIIVEGLVNSWAFASGSDMGWLGGLQEAMLVALVNVTTAFFAGLLITGVFHVSLFRKLLALLVGAAYVGFIIGYALLTAHYRGALIGDNPASAVSEAVLRLLHTPLAVYDFQSIILLLCTLGFAAAALVTGTRTKDRYPGYTDVSQRYQAALAQFNHWRQRYREGIDAVFQHRPEQVEHVLEEAREAQYAYRATLDESRQLLKRYECQHGDIVASNLAVMQCYRSINQQIRNDDAPVTFNRDPVLGESSEFLELHRAVIAEAEVVAEQFQAQTTQLQHTADAVKERLNRLYQQARRGESDFFALTDAVAEGRVQALSDSKPSPTNDTATPSAAQAGPDATDAGSLASDGLRQVAGTPAVQG